MSSDSVAMTTAIRATQITISPHDPIIVRDSRPFATGGEGANHARSLDWPYPSTTAGAVRTLIGRLALPPGNGGAGRNPFHDVAFLDRLKSLEVWGPLPLVGDGLYVPAPLDYLVYESGRQACLRPMPLDEGEGCDLPEGLWPIHIPYNEKPGKAPTFWSMKTAAKWLAQDQQEEFALIDGLEGFTKEERVHVRIDPDTGTADDSQLFSTQGLVIPDIDHRLSSEFSLDASGLSTRATRVALLVHSENANLAPLLSAIDGFRPLGGERRLATFHAEIPSSSWTCPATVKESMSYCSDIRMLLATPAIFRNGWLPGWLDPKTFEGNPPGANDVRLRLRGACVGRWCAVSGWSLERGHFGPKPIRRIVPAGSVYFFEVLGGSSERLADRWLCPVSDELQDRNDGFGLAVWGVWNKKPIEGGSKR